MAKHVVVVGAGIIGLHIALACAQRGWRVTVLDRNPERRDGCSFGNTGLIVPSHFVPLAAPGAVGRGLRWLLDSRSPFYVKPRLSWDLLDWAFKFWRASSPTHVQRAAPLLRDLMLASREWYETFAARHADLKFAPTGTLMLCKTAHAFAEEARSADHARELGLAAEVLDAAQAAALDPSVRMDIAGAVHFPQDARLVPERLMAVLEQRLHEAGACFAWGAEVSGWKVERMRIRAAKLAGGGEVEADEFALAGGSWSPRLAQQLGLKLPIQAGKGYSLTLSEPRRLPKHAAILIEARAAVSPLDGALRIGGTMELGGLDESIDSARVRAIAEAIPRYYPDLRAEDFAGIRPWRGLRPCSPDGLPYIGRTRRCPNLVVGAGHAMLGVSLGPITGKLAAEILAGEQPSFDVAALSPDRFH